MLGRKRLSCYNCRKRKTKCDLRHPCLACGKKNLQCTYPNVDERTLRSSVSELNYYKTVAKRLEDILNIIKNFRNDPDRLADFLNNLDSEFTPVEETDVSGNNEKYPLDLGPILISDGNRASVRAFGPSSIYTQVELHNYKAHGSKISIEKGSRENTPPGKERFVIPNQVPIEKFDPILYSSISSFFMWQYPSIHLFIHRESFLFHFLQLDFENIFVSKELVFAITAVGASQSPKDKIREHAADFYHQSSRLVFSSSKNNGCIDLSSSSLTRLQTLLCLALYDLINGNISSCWLLSGLALRMTSDLGFEWGSGIFNDDKGLYTLKGYPFQITEVQQRIFWGCYITDHFISLILGRQPMLRKRESNVPPSIDLKDLANIKDFLFYDPKVKCSYNISAAISTIELVKLIEIGEPMLYDVFGPRMSSKNPSKKKDFHIRLEKLDYYNNELSNWKTSLSEEISWTENSLLKTGYNYIAIAPRAYYFVLRLSLNRPFALLGKSYDKKLANAVDVCEETITELRNILLSIKEVIGIEHFTSTLPLAYAIVLAVSVCAWKYSTVCSEEGKNEIRISSEIFLKFLRLCAQSYKVAKDALSIFESSFSETSSNNRPQCQVLSVQNRDEFVFTNSATSFDSFLHGDVFDFIFEPNSGFLMWDSDYQNIFKFDP